MKTIPSQPTEAGSASPPETEPGAPVLASPAPAAGSERRLSGAIILGVPFLLVVVTFLFWYQTWFGRRLSESDLREYLEDTSVPHKTQHALTQAVEEILRHDPAVERVYPQIVALAGNKEPGLRSMAAWVMGQDNKSQEFHTALLKLIEDPEPAVRWNAALGLVRFGDDTGEPQLRSMLHPLDLSAAQAGTITFDVKDSDAVRAGSIVARIAVPGADEVEIRSPVAGLVARRSAEERVAIRAGDVIAVISPDEQQIWEALAALDLVGKPEDLKDVERFAANGMSDRVRQQAVQTAAAIRRRI